MIPSIFRWFQPLALHYPLVRTNITNSKWPSRKFVTLTIQHGGFPFPYVNVRLPEGTTWFMCVKQCHFDYPECLKWQIYTTYQNADDIRLVSFPIRHGDFPVRYVNVHLPEGISMKSRKSHQITIKSTKNHHLITMKSNIYRTSTMKSHSKPPFSYFFLLFFNHQPPSERPRPSCV